MNFVMTIIFFIFVKNIFANDLPDLGDSSQATISPYEERQIGLQIMSQIRADSRYLDDAEIAGYLTNLGYKLILSSKNSNA